MTPFALALLLAAGPTHAAVACSWSDPGHDPFRGNAVLAILTEPSLPSAVALRLAWDYRTRRPTERLHIWRDQITGERGGRYSPHLIGMRFGTGRRCEEVDRGGWGALQSEPASAWCAEGHCVVVPDVCGNVSFVRQYAAGVAAARAVPEPGTLLLVALAGLVAVGTRRKRGPNAGSKAPA